METVNGLLNKFCSSQAACFHGDLIFMLCCRYEVPLPCGRFGYAFASGTCGTSDALLICARREFWRKGWFIASVLSLLDMLLVSIVPRGRWV
ncbi:hypothetical protein K458DRAFT_194892 [Lentithecium fluviatile CBS 122367]|uniref:Uncharacterized protein n=1 Tax=Lentithecium fluviatile CBS 122367 TaxID=1168545 RepID=A0A6G1ICU3_9PLEO|nr:hypothetical protein K458DRAFT_194892 [Lentithecium fluviatile CBS 122367]